MTATASLSQSRDGAPTTAPRLFGTDGIRMVVGREMKPGFIAEVGSALGTYLHGTGDVLVARDFRVSSEAIASILSGAVMMTGVNVREMGTMPTPCLQFNIKALQASAGVTVTASHNPNEFNGIKFTGPEGTEIPREAEQSIEHSLEYKQFVPSTWDRVGTLRVDRDGIDRYVGSILHHSDVTSIRQWNPLVVLDSGNGTSAVTSPALLRELGCRVMTLNASPDGHFPGRPSEPTEENLWALRRAVVEFGAQLGIAHDGDSDRVAFVDELGHYVPGDVTLALLAQNRLKSFPGATIVTSVTSSTLVEDVVRQSGGKLCITRSGSLAVATGIIQNGATFGGEENGGYYWPEHQVARDGPMSSAKMLELLAHTRRPLSELTAELPSYVVAKTKVPLDRRIKDQVLARVQDLLAAESLRLVTMDGLKAYYDDGWLLVRPSGTEPICRVYAEARRSERARMLMDHGVELVQAATRALETDLKAPG
jgi:phosphomannomutase / phosphoglucomutase